MTALPSGPIEVASASGIVIAEDGPRVLVYDRRLGGLAVATFVMGLIGFIMLSNGVIFTVLGTTDQPPPPALGWTLLAVAVPLLVGAMVLWRQLSARRRQPVGELRPVVVFDRSSGVVHDANGDVLGRLDQVLIRRRMQLGSSSPALVARFPDRTVTLGKASPFTGGLGRLDADLAQLLTG